MAGDGNFKWWVATEEDSEWWSGPYANRADAIAAGTVEKEGEPFWLHEADKSVCVGRISHAAHIAEQLIEDLAEVNAECWSEDGWDDAWSAEATKDLERSIEAMVADWLKRHPANTWAAGDIRITEKVVPDPLKDVH